MRSLTVLTLTGPSRKDGNYRVVAAPAGGPRRVGVEGRDRDVSAVVRQPSVKKRTCRATTVTGKVTGAAEAGSVHVSEEHSRRVPVITPPVDLPTDILFSTVLKSSQTRRRGCWLPSHRPCFRTDTLLLPTLRDGSLGSKDLGVQVPGDD